MEKIIESPHLRNQEAVFENRRDAGSRLGVLMQAEGAANGLLLPIPAGGVPVALAMQELLGWPLELLLVRKVQIPWNTEAGFGAVNMDGDRLFNEPLRQSLRLSEEVEAVQVRKALRSIEQRNTLLRGDRPFADLTGKTVIIVDDGLASGFTMLAALRFVKQRQPATVMVAVPTGLLESVEKVAGQVDRIYCPNIRNRYPFAVASAYRNWHDVGDEELLRMLGHHP
jgi:putative phosphoribosyl transferase